LKRPLSLVAFAASTIVAFTACGAVGAQDTPTPAPAADVFEPRVAEATPIAGVEVFEVASSDHTTDAVSYPQDPPAGGPHDPSWQKCEFYAAPVRNENAVHSLEHGAVWITYQAGLPQEERDALRELAGTNPFILVSPYPNLPDPVVASAWGAQLRLPTVDDPRLQEFIARYANNGPEPGANCASGVETTVSG
jgi:hypothetical protein